MKYLLFLVMLLVSCGSEHTPLEEQISAVALAEWDRAGFPAPRESCRIEELRVVAHRSTETFQEACAAPGEEPSHVHADACLVWGLEAPRVRSIEFPAVHVSPSVAEDRVFAAAVHETLHALIYCSLVRTRHDPYDARHTDLRIWEKGGPASVETQVELALQ